MENLFQWLLLILVGFFVVVLCRIVSSLRWEVIRLQAELASREAIESVPPMSAAMRVASNVYAQMNSEYFSGILAAVESALEEAGYCLVRDLEKEAMLPWNVETKIGEAISRAQFQYARPNLARDELEERVQRDAEDGYGRAWLGHMITALRRDGRYVARTAGAIDQTLLDAA